MSESRRRVIAWGLVSFDHWIMLGSPSRSPTATSSASASDLIIERRSRLARPFSTLLSQSLVRPTRPARTSWEMPRRCLYQAARSPIDKFCPRSRM